MTDAYLLEMDDQGHSTYYIVDEATFKAAEEADLTGDEGLQEWFNEQSHPIPWNKFVSLRDVNKHLTMNDMVLKDEIKGYLY